MKNLFLAVSAACLLVGSAVAAPFDGLYGGPSGAYVTGNDVGSSTMGFGYKKATAGYFGGVNLTYYQPFSVFGFDLDAIGALDARLGNVGRTDTFSGSGWSEVDRHTINSLTTLQAGLGVPVKVLGRDFLPFAAYGCDVTTGNDASTYVDSNGTSKYKNDTTGVSCSTLSAGVSAKIFDNAVFTVSYTSAPGQTDHYMESSPGFQYKFHQTDTMNVVAATVTIQL